MFSLLPTFNALPAPTTCHFDDCFQNDGDIKPHRTVLNIVKVVMEFFARIQVRATIVIVHLRPSGQSRLDLHATAIARNVLLQVGYQHWLLWTWPYQAHLAAQNVDDLRELVEVGHAQETSHPRDPRIIDTGPYLLPCEPTIREHRAELVN